MKLLTRPKLIDVVAVVLGTIFRQPFVAIGQGIFKFGFVVVCLLTSQLLLMPSRSYADAVDANGNAVSEPGDGKTSVIDNSKGKEAPSLVPKGCVTPPDTEFRIGMPGWLAGISGDSGVKGVVSSIDVGFDQLLRHLTHVPIVLSADFRYQRWEIFADGQYMEVGASAALPGLLFTTANLHLKSALAEGFVGYRLINCDKAALSLFAGARYSYMDGHLNIFDNGDARLVVLRRLLGIPNGLDFSGSIDWVDPVVGARGRVKIWKATSLYAEGDIGGFDANSGSAFAVHRQGLTIVKTPVSSEDWSYQIQGGLEIQMTRSMWTQIGWRYFKYDYVSEGFTNKTEMSGPFIQGGVNF